LEHHEVGCRVLEPSYVGRNVVADPGATIGPFAVIGDGCKIEGNAVIRDSVLWDRVTIGSGARVEGAILASHVIVGDHATIEAGAVIGHGAHIAPGSYLQGNARLSVS